MHSLETVSHVPIFCDLWCHNVKPSIGRKATWWIAQWVRYEQLHIQNTADQSKWCFIYGTPVFYYCVRRYPRGHPATQLGALEKNRIYIWNKFDRNPIYCKLPIDCIQNDDSGRSLAFHVKQLNAHITSSPDTAAWPLIITPPYPA